MSILTTVSTKSTPQTQRTIGRTDEVRNDAGGYVFEVSDQQRLLRFLVLGVDGGTYYVTQKQRLEDNVDFITGLISKDEALVLREVVRVSDEGLAYSNSPAIFTLAAILAFGKDKTAARAAVEKVIRTATHMYEFAQYVENLGGWGPAKRKSVTGWFANKDFRGNLDYQAVKYRSRKIGNNVWSLRDLMRLSHAKGISDSSARFILTGEVTEDASVTLRDFAAIQSADNVGEVIALLSKGNLPWEAMPTQFHKSPDVWKALFHAGSLNGQALVRNVTRLSRNGAFDDMLFAAEYAAALNDEEMIQRTRLHPINYLNAVVVHKDGQINRNDFWGHREKNWTTNSVVLDALNDGFHTSFKHVRPTGKRTMIAIDVSGSMSTNALGLDLSCAQVSAAMGMTVARTEPAHIIRGFTSSNNWNCGGGSDLTDLGISAKTSLPDAMKAVQRNNWGRTDCALPMVWATKNNVEVDTFVVITDNDTWAGNIKPTQALEKYRQKTGIDARLAVLGTASNGFTIADPKDMRQMDFVGFSSDTPKVVADFSAGRI